MVWNTIARDREHLDRQYLHPVWNEQTGLSADELRQEAETIIDEMAGQPKPLIKARVIALVLQKGRIEVDPLDWFADRLDHGGIVTGLRGRWWREINKTVMGDKHREERWARSMGAYQAGADFSHTSPDWNDILSLGIEGLLCRIRNTRENKRRDGVLSRDQAVFYDSAEIVYEAVILFMRRLAAEARRQSTDNERMARLSACLEALSRRPPETLYEALQLAYLFRQLQEEIEGERVRSFGGFDRLYYPFYRSDIQNGRFTREQEKELIQYFFIKISALATPYNQPLYLGGVDTDGNDAVNELSYLALEAYQELNIYDPKIHIRVHGRIADDFLIKALDCIRSGSSSIVFINDEAAIPALMNIGITEAEARDYVPIGCYEPAVLGREVGCTGSALVNIAKAVELALYNGLDPLTGEMLGARSGDYEQLTDFDRFYGAFTKQLQTMITASMDIVRAYEGYYMQINPSPLFSSTLHECVEQGRDAYGGGAKYNNSSVTCIGIASAVDSLLALRSLVFDKRVVTMKELAAILKDNWSGRETLCLNMLHSRDKYGNNRPEPDRLACEIAAFVANAINNQPNGRGGVFKAGLFSIDHCHTYGEKMGATPDGRKAHEPLSKNLGAVTAMDRQGITALIRSVTRMDLSRFPNGSVLDFILHPSAVQGDEGLSAMLGLVKTYFRQGGFAIHGNVFYAETLREAQENPDKFATLQVRVCGWNVYFVNLSRAEQNEFIRQAEHAEQTGG